MESFYAELMKYAARMVEPPDNYTIRRKLMEGLPAEVYRILALERNINAEESSVDEILTSARQVERALIRARRRENQDREHRPITVAAIANPRAES